MVKEVLHRIHSHQHTGSFVNECLRIVHSHPSLATSYLLIKNAIQAQNWLAVMREFTKILKEPTTKPIVYEQLKRLLKYVEQNKNQLQAMLQNAADDTDPIAVEQVKAAIELAFAMGGLVADFKMKKVIHDLTVEIGDCCKVFVEQQPKKKGFFRKH